MYDISVFIGRFQPFHKGHLHNISIAAANSRKVIINIGSCFNPRSTENPFSFQERKQMIESDLKLTKIDSSMIKIEALADYPYQEQKWQKALHGNINKHAKSNQSITMVGHIKDASSYYLKSFPDWGYISVDNYKGYNATDFRKNFYKGTILVEYMCSKDQNFGTHKIIKKFMQTDIFKKLALCACKS